MTLLDFDPAAAGEILDHHFGAYTQEAQPGLAIALLHKEQVLCSRCYGRANIEHNIPWRQDTPARIASLSKHIAAALVLAMARADIVNMDADIRELLPELSSQLPHITLSHLLTNRSGLCIDESLARLAGHTTHCPADLDYLFRLVCKQSATMHPVGAAYVYNDTGFRLAMRMIERAAEANVDELAQHYLFQPLGMRNTGFVPNDEVLTPGLARCYHRVTDGTLKPYFGYMESSGDGAIVSTLDDVILWLQNLIKPKSGFEWLPDALRSPPASAGVSPNIYAYGLDLGRHRGRDWWGHTGALFGYCGLHVFGDGELAVLFLGNHNRIDIRGLSFQLFDDLCATTDRDGPSTPYLRRRKHLEACKYDHVPSAIDGRYMHADTGLVVDLEQTGDVVRLGFLGSGAYLCRRDDREWIAEEGHMSCCIRHLQQDDKARPSFQMNIGDGWLDFVRVEGECDWQEMRHRCIGTYYASSLASIVEIVEELDAPVLRIAGGATQKQNVKLTPIDDTVLFGESLSIKCPVQTDGQFEKLALSNVGARSIIFERIG